MTKTPSLSDQRAVRNWLEAVRRAGRIPDGLDGLDLPATDVPAFKARARELAEQVLAAERDGESGQARRIISLEAVDLDRQLLADPPVDGGHVVTSDEIRQMVADMPRGIQ